MEKQNFKGVPESNWVVGPCITEEIAKQVLAVAHAYGWKWCSGNLFIDKTNWNQYKKGTYYNIAIGEYCDFEYWKSRKCTIISPETFLANNPMPGEKPEEKTRKPGVKYTLDDWKKEADACRKRAEYWKDKFFSMNEFYDQLKLENKQLKAFADELKSEKDFIDTDRNDVRHTLANIKLDLDHTNKNYTILQTENKVLKESNADLRGANDELKEWSKKEKASFDRCIENNKKEIGSLEEELKTVKSHLDLRTKGIQVLEHDAKLNRIEIASLKYDFETKNSELEILEEDYNCLKDVQKYTKVVGWAGWILFFIALFGLMFYKG